MYSFMLIWSAVASSCSCLRMYSCFFFRIFAHRIHIIAPTTKVPAAILVFQIRMAVEYYWWAFSLQIPHYFGYTVFGRYSHLHVYVIPAKFCFYYFYPFLSHNSRNIFPISFSVCHIWPAFCTLGQTQCDTYIPTLYLLKYFCPFGLPPLLMMRSANLHHLNIGGLFFKLKLYSLPRQSRGFIWFCPLSLPKPH